MRIISACIAIWSVGVAACASNEYRVDLDSRFASELGAPPKLESSNDEAEFYACRFALRTRNELITIHVYTTVPRDPLTKGSRINNDGESVYAFGFRPEAVSARIERRFLSQGVVTVSEHSLNEAQAAALDSSLVRSGFFELDGVGPWLLTSDGAGELLIGELLIDGRSTIVRRYTDRSLPASACVEAIERALNVNEQIKLTH